MWGAAAPRATTSPLERARDNPSEAGRRFTLELDGIIRSVESCTRTLGRDEDSVSRRARMRTQLTRGDELCRAVSTAASLLRSGGASEAEAAYDFDRAVERFERVAAAYRAGEERAGPARTDRHGSFDRRESLVEPAVSDRATEMQVSRTLRDGRVDIAYELAEERRAEVDHVARDAAAIRDMSADVAVLIGEQGESVDKVAESLSEAHGAIKEGSGDLETTISYSKALRQKYCFCAIVAMLILAAILIPTLIHVLGRNRSPPA